MRSLKSKLVVLIFLVPWKVGSATLLDDGCKPAIRNAMLFATNAGPSPWMAYLMRNGNFICGGTLVSHFFTLTAGHCVNSTDNFIVRLGEYNTKDDIPTTDFQVVKFLAHSRRDIALLKLHKEVLYSDYVKPICILASEFYKQEDTNNEFYVTGWGATSDFNRTSSDVLKEIEVRRMLPSECDEVEGDICCGHPKDKQFICEGDSGGPLFAYVKYKKRTILAQYGVVRATSTLCRDHAYYVDVKKASDWIFSVVNNAKKSWFLHRILLERFVAKV